MTPTQYDELRELAVEFVGALNLYSETVDDLMEAATDDRLDEELERWLEPDCDCTREQAAECESRGHGFPRHFIVDSGAPGIAKQMLAIVERRYCECECGCGDEATRTDDGFNLCDDCSEYFVDHGGDVHCAKSGAGETCHDCGEKIDWGGIQTGQPGSGRPNWMEGTCGCAGRTWGWSDCGGWPLHACGYSDADEDDSDDEEV